MTTGRITPRATSDANRDRSRLSLQVSENHCASHDHHSLGPLATLADGAGHLPSNAPPNLARQPLKTVGPEGHAVR